MKRNTQRKLPTCVRAIAVVLLVIAAHSPLSALRIPQLRFAETLQFNEISPGIEHAQINRRGTSKEPSTGPWFINVLRVDLRKAGIKIVRALDEGVGMETVSSLVARHGAVAGINGGYFRTTGTYRGESLGVLLLNEKLISESHKDRAAAALINDGRTSRVVFAHIKFHGELAIGSDPHKVDGLNRPVAANELLIFTPEFHRTTLTNNDVTEVIVRKNRIVSIHERKGSNVIPHDGFVIAASGETRNWIKRHARKGSIARFSWRLDASTNGDVWRKAISIIGGGPQLVKNGTIAITNTQESITPAFTSELHPRTAIGVMSSGKVLLVTVDGRQPDVSVGMSLPALASLLVELGAVDAINLDGGGSTTMVLRDKVVNRPSDQTGERPVSDAILIFSK